MLGQALHLLSRYTVKDRSRLRMSIRRMTRVSSRDSVHKHKPLPVYCHHGEEPIREINQQRWPGSTPGLFSWALLHSPSLEEAGIRGVLLDAGAAAKISAAITLLPGDGPC